MRVRKLPDGVCWLVSTSLSKQRMELQALVGKPWIGWEGWWWDKFFAAVVNMNSVVRAY